MRPVPQHANDDVVKASVPEALYLRRDPQSFANQIVMPFRKKEMPSMRLKLPSMKLMMSSRKRNIQGDEWWCVEC